MKYGLAQILIGVALIFVAFLRQGWALTLAWLGFNFVIAGCAHLSRYHFVFGKRFDGTIPLWSWILFLPLHLYTLCVWHIVRLLSREPVHSQLTPDIIVGRRLLVSELAGDFNNVIDLTAELQEPRQIRTKRGYQCFPILDASAPSVGALITAVNNLAPGRTFIHCAQGHGRTGLFALAVLLKKGQARDCAEGLRILQRIRPGIALSRSQLQCIENLDQQLKRRQD